ncbi:histidine phosphatase family protein [Rhizobium sp. ARZ01]|uniref:histidine phosphatase family protein n=1 Tax=Rhizobium sp. ARZ01 TaxID=2769313 RepID=UPI00177E536D|nr:histidine phosphatase family protein [Rhizobium sp. ARZ01]MBD9374120.1 histidine phosphatase family protein [Rhizobium sp. ARZ01]
MFAVYITHPQVRIDPNIAVPEWGLSEIGQQRAIRSAKASWVASLTRIVSSDEKKAIETAEILAKAAKVPIETMAGMGENDRSATGFLPPDRFEEAADWFFAHPTESFRGWERAIDAQARISSNVSKILDSHDPAKPIAFIGHGGVGTLLKCHLQGHPIARSHDQPAGGGNLFAFRLADRLVTCDWTAMEYWKGM